MISGRFVGSESLLTELLIYSILDCVNFKSVRVAVDVMVLGEQIRDWIESGYASH